MMMMTTLDKSTLLTRIAGDTRKVGAKIAKELESAEIVFSDKKNEKNHAVERAVDEKGKTVITIYESNMGTENKEALAAYYLSLEGTKMLMARKSTVADKAKLETNAEFLIAANEVAYGISQATKKSGTEEAELKAIRKVIDTDVSSKQAPTSGNSDAVEVLESAGIIGLSSIEARAKKLSKTDSTPPTTTGKPSTKEAASEETKTEETEEDKAKAATTSDADKPKIATPRSTSASDATTDTAKDSELVNLGAGQPVMSRKDLRTLIKTKNPTMVDSEIEKYVALAPKADAANPFVNTAASPNDMFMMNGVQMGRDQATAQIKAVMPTLASADVEKVLASNKITNTSATLAGATNPNEMVEFMGQKLQRSLATTLAKQLFPTLPEAQLSTMFKPVVSTPTVVNQPVGMPTPTGIGVNSPAQYGTQPRSTITPQYNNSSVFAAMPTTTNPLFTGVGSTGRTPSGLQIVKAGT